MFRYARLDFQGEKVGDKNSSGRATRFVSIPDAGHLLDILATLRANFFSLNERRRSRLSSGSICFCSAEKWTSADEKKKKE